jgi:hypothetical protein
MLYEALTGDLPAMAPTLPGATPAELATQRPVLKGVSPHTWEVVEKALAPASRRFETAEALAVALRAAQNPHWPGLTTEELPALKSLAGEPRSNAASLKPQPPIAKSKDTPFQAVLRSEPETSNRAPWVVLAALGFSAAGFWIWQSSKQPQATKPLPSLTQPTPSSPVVQAPPPQAPGIQSQTPIPSPTSVQSTDSRTSSPLNAKALPPATAINPEPSRAMTELATIQSRVKERPRDVWEAAQAVLREQPGNPSAHGLSFASLYWMGRMKDMEAVVIEAKRQNVQGYQFGSLASVREVMEDERVKRRFPPELVQRVHEFLPPPADRKE